MTTKTAGGKITGLLALTLEGTPALAVGDWVELSAAYTVILATGTKPVLGRVSVANVKRTSTSTTTTYPAPNATGAVTVETPGFAVYAETCDANVAVGDLIVIGASGAVKPIASGVVNTSTEKIIGVALTAASSGGVFDLLSR